VRFISIQASLYSSSQAFLDAGLADLIAIGRPFISNPDLVERLHYDWPLTEPDHATSYEGGRHGYIDYPTFEPNSMRQLSIATSG
jgi:N-ethylmaleimide reductase